MDEGNKRQQSNSPAQATEARTLRQQLDDVENQEQQNNWCFMGFPEDNKNGDALSSVSKTLLKILNIDLPKGLEIDRAHRIWAEIPGFWLTYACKTHRRQVFEILEPHRSSRIDAHKKGKISWKELQIMI